MAASPGKATVKGPGSVPAPSLSGERFLRGGSFLLHPQDRRALHLYKIWRQDQRLKRKHALEASVKPLLVIVAVKQGRHAIMDRRDRLIGVDHHAGIDRSPFVAYLNILGKAEGVSDDQSRP